MGNGLCGGYGLLGDNSQPASPTAATSPGLDDRPQPRHRGFISQEAPAPSDVFGQSTQATVATAAEAEAEADAPPATAQAEAEAAAAAAYPPPPAAARVPLMGSTRADRRAAEDLKTEGNALFAKGKYVAAIEKYTEAITLCPEWAVLYVNRGMAARKRGDWARVEADAGAALSLGPGEREAMKGHYLLGLAMGAREQHEKSTFHLRKALDAAREANDSIKDEIWRELATANYQQWETQSAARRAQSKALRGQLAAMLGSSPASPGPGAGAGCEEPHLPADWAALFKAAAWQDTAVEAPSQFTCPLTMEIFRDPVVVPSGRSYERSALLEHLKKVGRFDPITRQALSEEQLIPNVSLRAAIELYLQEHPWGWGEVNNVLPESFWAQHLHQPVGSRQVGAAQASLASARPSISEAVPCSTAHPNVVRLISGAAKGCQLDAMQRLYFLYVQEGQEEEGEQEEEGVGGAPRRKALSPSAKDFILAAAINSPMPDWQAKVEWLEARGFPQQLCDWEAKSLFECADWSARLTWLRQQRYIVSYTELAEHAARSGNVTALVSLLLPGALTGNAAPCMLEVAAYSGHVHILDLLATRGLLPPNGGNGSYLGLLHGSPRVASKSRMCTCPE
ncbi:hypothetical protein PLESTF_001642900 [Pleodorina starrii]|nr:hypothetical protein PLESTF_001642900 [Pleodorina starrii]